MTDNLYQGLTVSGFGGIVVSLILLFSLAIPSTSFAQEKYTYNYVCVPNRHDAALFVFKNKTNNELVEIFKFNKKMSRDFFRKIQISARKSEHRIIVNGVKSYFYLGTLLVQGLDLSIKHDYDPYYDGFVVIGEVILFEDQWACSNMEG